MGVASFGLGTIRSALYLDTQQYKQALAQATGMTQAAVSRNNKILALQAGSANVGMAAAMGATLVAPMLAVVNRVQKVYGDYEQVLAKIRTVSNSTAQEMKVLNNQFIANGKMFGETPTELAKAGYVSAQAMFSSFKEMKKISTASAQLRLASGGEITTEQSAEALTRMLQAFSLGVSKIDEINDVLIKTRDVGAVSMDALADSVRNVASAYAQAFPNKRMEAFKEMMTLMASGTQAGIAPSVMATGLRGMLARVYTESGKPKSPMNALAVSKGFQNAAHMLQGGAIPFLRIVKDASGGYLELLDALNYERREMAGVSAVIRGGMKNTEDARKAIDGSAGAIDEASTKMKATWWYVKNSFSATKEAMALAFGPSVIKMLYTISELLTKIFNYFASIPEAGKNFIVMTSAVIGLRVALSALGGALQILGIRWTSMIPGLSTVLSLLTMTGGTQISPLANTNKKAWAKWMRNIKPVSAVTASAVGSTSLGLGTATAVSLADLGLSGGSYATHKIHRVPFEKYRAREADRNFARASNLWGIQNLLSMRRRSSIPTFARQAQIAPWLGLVANRGRSMGGAVGDWATIMMMQMSGMKRRLPSGSIRNNSVSGIGDSNIMTGLGALLGLRRNISASSNLQRVLADTGRPLNRNITGGMLSGTPSNRSVAGFGMDNVSRAMSGVKIALISAFNGIASSAKSIFSSMKSALIVSWVSLSTSLKNTTMSAFTYMIEGAKVTALQTKELFATSLIPGAKAGGAKVGKGMGDIAILGLGGIWKAIMWVGRLLASLASKLVIVLATIGAIVGLYTVAKNNIEQLTNLKIGDWWKDMLDSMKQGFGWLVMGFVTLFEGLATALKIPFKGWEKSKEEFVVNFKKALEEWVPEKKVYSGPAEYFKELIDKMVKESSPTGLMDDLDEEDRLKIMREIMTPKHDFYIPNEMPGHAPLRIRNGALLDAEARMLFGDLFEAPYYPDTGEGKKEGETPEGLPQWQEEVKIKLGEFADAMTLGTAEAWKAITPKYFVEEKTLKLQEQQLKLSDETKTIIKEVADNTSAMLGKGAFLEAANMPA